MNYRLSGRLVSYRGMKKLVVLLMSVFSLTAAADFPCCLVDGVERCGTKLECDPVAPVCGEGHRLQCHNGLAPECYCVEDPLPGQSPDGAN
jgi:hypothetical protein